MFYVMTLWIFLPCTRFFHVYVCMFTKLKCCWNLATFKFKTIFIFRTFPLGCCCSIHQSCLTLCDPMVCSTQGYPVLHHLPALAQIHVHWVSDAIQPSLPLSSPSPHAFNLSQHQGLFKYWSFSFNISPSSEYSGLLGSPCSPRDSQKSLI